MKKKKKRRKKKERTNLDDTAELLVADEHFPLLLRAEEKDLLRLQIREVGPAEAARELVNYTRGEGSHLAAAVAFRMEYSDAEWKEVQRICQERATGAST